MAALLLSLHAGVHCAFVGSLSPQHTLHRQAKMVALAPYSHRAPSFYEAHSASQFFFDDEREILRPTALSALSSIGSTYRSMSETHYLATACVQGCLLRITANYAAQLLLVARGLQSCVGLATLLTMAALGATVSGCTNAGWSRWLDNAVGHAHGARDVVKKALIDFVLWAPVCNSSYLLLCPMMNGAGLAAALQNVSERFLSVMALEAAVFTPYHIAAFSSIPQEVRPLCHSAVAAIFTVGLSLMC